MPAKPAFCIVSFFAFAAALCLLDCGCASKKRTETSAGNTGYSCKIIETSGKVEATASGSKRTAKSGETLKDLSAIETGDDSAAAVEIAGSTLWLGSTTALTVNSASTGTLDISIIGEACGRFTRDTVLRLKSGVIYVKNCGIYLSARAGTIPRIAVFAGSAEVKPDMASSARTTAGNRVEVITGKTPTSNRIPSAASILSLIEWAERIGFSPDKSALPADISISLDSPRGIPERGRIRLVSGGSAAASEEFAKTDTVYIPGIAPGKYTLEIEADGFENLSGITFELAGGDVKSVAAALSPVPESALAGAIEGLVLDSERQPIAGACVTFGKYKTESDAGGAFGIKGLKPGADILMVDADGFDIWAREIEVFAGNSSKITVALSANPAELGATSGDLLVYARDEAGNALRGVAVRVFGENLSAPPDAVTGDTGTVMFPDLKSGVYNVIVRRVGFRESREEVEVKSGKTAEIILTLEK
jgi:hypothetical protein